MQFKPDGVAKLKCVDCGKYVCFTERNELVDFLLRSLPVWCFDCRKKLNEAEQAAKYAEREKR